MELLVSSLLSTATQYILDGEPIDSARTAASLGCYFEETWIKHLLSEKKHGMNQAKVIELRNGDEHTFVKYLRSRIPCKCLDEKYKDVKSITKMGICFNPQCPHVDRERMVPAMVERKGMVYCTNCCVANYCTRECQEAAWPDHKEECDKWSTKDM